MKNIFITLLLALLPAVLTAQDDASKLTMLFLGNDKITEVNIVSTEDFAKKLEPLFDVMEAEMKDLPKTQAVGVKITLHKTGVPTYEMFSDPKLNAKKVAEILNKVKAVKMGNTKIVDFPIFISFNAGVKAEKFKVKTLAEERKTEFEAADLTTKVKLNKKWAAEEVLPVLAAYETSVEDKFAGVKAFGAAIAAKDFRKPQDVDKLTSNNPDYWRAVMEMSGGNQIIPVTKIFTMVAQAEFDYAGQFASLLRAFTDNEALATLYLDEVVWRKEQFNVTLDALINKGIAEHDKGSYAKAIAIYNEVLKDYPASAWAKYELYFSQNALDAQKSLVKQGDREQWLKAKVAIYGLNPLYDIDVNATTGREAWLCSAGWNCRVCLKIRATALMRYMSMPILLMTWRLMTLLRSFFG
ncbi:MAG: hypothetical protein V4581_11285 [Bacteroidota bacterium]